MATAERLKALLLLFVSICSSSTTSARNSPPPGCVCMNDMCDQFDCGCDCDLTRGACDLNCCCDEECGDHTFIECIDSTPSTPFNKVCTERASPLEASNDLPIDQLDRIVCIEQDNSPVKGVFFMEDKVLHASSVFFPGSKLAKPVTFHSNAEGDGSSYGTYQLGDAISVYSLSEEGVISTNGKLLLPSLGDGGHCIDSNAVGYGKNMHNSCRRNMKDFANECETKFNVNRYVPSFVEAIKGSSIAGPLQANAPGSVVPISIANKQAPSFDESVCKNALKSLTYNILYNQTTILEISVEAELVDIDESESELMQDFSIQFIPAGTKELYARSGNPGYIIGKPTLGARSPNINETASWFTVMDTGAGGQCSQSTPTGSTVGFAKDVLVGCTQSMTRQELKEFCTSDAHSMLIGKNVGDDTFVYPKWLESNQDFLGTFGNADPLDNDQWVKIASPMNEPTFAVKSRNWIDSESKCMGMPSKLRIEILWTYVGNVQNPQAKILSAKKSFDEVPLHHTLLPNEKQQFTFSTTVSWTYAPPTSNIVKSPPPILIFSVPHDVFYPFLMSSSQRIQCTSGWMIIASSVVLFWFGLG